MNGKGLLDFVKTPEGQGLLGGLFGYASQAQRGAPINSIGRGGLAGLLAYGNASTRQDEQAERLKMGQYRDAQIGAFNAKAAADAEALARERAKREALPGLFKAPGMTGGEAMPQELGGLPMFSQPMGVTPMQSTPGGFDIQGALRAGYGAKEIQELVGLQDAGRAEVARTLEVDDGRGGKATVQLDKFGRPVGQNMPGYVPPVQVDTGKGVQFVTPRPGVSLAKQPTFGDDIARGQLGVSQERLRFEKSDPKLAWNSDLGAFVNPRTREVMPALGANGQPVGGAAGPKLTEDQGKATGWLVQAENAWKNMQKVGMDKDGNVLSAARPGFNDALAAVPSFGLTTGAANMMRGADRQKFMQGASSLSEALLRAATGAGVNRDEAEQKVREITPVFGDDEETVKQKMAAIPLYLETLKVRAGPGAKAAGSISRGGATGGWSIQKVQ